MCAEFDLKAEKKKEKNGNMEHLNNYWIMEMDELGSVVLFPLLLMLFENIHNKNVVDERFSSLKLWD